MGCTVSPNLPVLLLPVGRGTNSSSAVSSTEIWTESTSPPARAGWSYSQTIGNWSQPLQGTVNI